MLKPYIKLAVEGENLNAGQAREAMSLVMRGEATPAQLAAWLIALRQKGETPAELEGFARAMRAAMVGIDGIAADAIDTCGTGGDGLGTFNVSTATALLAAACGVTVAKHGNRAVSSQCGSADVLAALGFEIDPGVEVASGALKRTGFAFLFAPRFHPAMKHAAGPRKEIGVRTVFNLLGPICNPARVERQVIGVYDRRWQRPLASALNDLGARRALIVSGPEGADELLPLGENFVTELDAGAIREYAFTPEEAGIKRVTLDDIRGTSADGNAAIIREIASGTDNACAETVLLNAGAALWVAGRCSSVAEGVELARPPLRNGEMARMIQRAAAASRAENV